MAVVNLISPPRLFYRYWRMSFIDFVASMAGFCKLRWLSVALSLPNAFMQGSLFSPALKSASLLRLASPLSTLSSA
jgi:hypothetical protein